MRAVAPRLELLFSARNVSELVYLVPLQALVKFSVTITTYQLKIVPVQCDINVAYIVRRDVYFVMYQLTRPDDSFFTTTFTQSTD